MAANTHVYLSPHLDDAVLSCGGRIWQQAQAGERVLVVTLFAAGPSPGTPLSSFARELHARWGHPSAAAAERRNEDLVALRLLGAEPLHWPYADCVYRQGAGGRFLYDSEESLWDRIQPEEEGLIGELADRLAALRAGEGGSFYVPAGAGRHVDHRVVRRAARDAGVTETLYEEYPYAEDPRAVRDALGGERWQPELVALSGEALEAKAAAIACHRSQISTFWPGRPEMEAAIRAFAGRVGGGAPAERYWVRAR